MASASVDTSPSNTKSSVTVPSTPSAISSPNSYPQTPTPSTDDVEDLLLDCRYGELDPVSHFVETYGASALADARDERGNNVLHMCAANGHDDVLAYILTIPSLPPTLLTSGNDAGSTALHWTCLNAQLACAQRLVAFRPSSFLSSSSPTAAPTPTSISAPEVQRGGEQTEDALHEYELGPALIFARNAAGHTPLGEAERAGWDEGARWLVSVMDLQLDSSSSPLPGEENDDDKSEMKVGPDLGADGGKTSEKSRGEEDGVDEVGVEVEVEAELARLRISDGYRSLP